ncbi:MAG: type II secretion system protein [Thermodesulfobacteriota bacterium]|nr:type II secretion system protein [Thermodesulfobacteriota bacterium]
MTITKSPNHQITKSSSGFTLIEVLVATAIMGISLGVLLSGFAQGHRQAFRGDMARQAATIAESVLYGMANELESLSSSEEDVEDHPGWSYKVETRDLVLKITAQDQDQDQDQDQEEKEIEIPELKELVLTVQPPYNAHPFVLTGWIPAEKI